MELYEILWDSTLKELEKTVSTISYTTYLATLEPVDISGKNIVLRAPTEMFASQVSERLVDKIQAALAAANTGLTGFELCVGESREDYLKQKGMAPAAPIESAPIDPKYTFDSFVVGPSNKFLYAAAKAVSDNPGQSFNPLFIHGGTGLGKTHIMHAIANRLKSTKPGIQVLYAPCDKFTNELIDSIRAGRGRGAEFRSRYRSVDVLMIDDIQFLAKKQACQEEFFHTFNELYGQNKQIILSSDCPPKEIELLEERLRTRFEGGLTVDVQPPDIETKIAILQRKAEEKKTIIDIEVLTYLAENSGSDVRTLEGRLTKVIFASKLHECPITLSLAMGALEESAKDKEEAITATNIINCVCGFYKISKQDLLGKKKTKELVEHRQICTYLITELMSVPLVTVGQAMGGRDHTTVMHSRDKIAELVRVDNRVATEVRDLKNMILKK